MRHSMGWACLAAACLAASATAGEPASMEDLMTMRVDGELVVDATGKVESHTLKTTLDPKLTALIEQAIPRWSFFPPVVDGKPVRARSGMRITLAAREDDAGAFTVKIDNVVFTPPGVEPEQPGTGDDVPKVGKRGKMPNFPRYKVNGLVTIAMRFKPDGSVADIAPTQCSLYFAGGSEVVKERACREMEGNAVRALRSWKFEVPADPAASEGIIAVQYIVGDDRGQRIRETSEPGKWRVESRGTYQWPGWSDADGKQRVGSADMVGSEMLSGTSPLKFRSGGPEGT